MRVTTRGNDDEGTDVTTQSTLLPACTDPDQEPLHLPITTFTANIAVNDLLIFNAGEIRLGYMQVGIQDGSLYQTINNTIKPPCDGFFPEPKPNVGHLV